MMKSSKEIKIFNYLNERYTNVIYEPTVLYGTEFNLKIDFKFEYNGKLYFLEYSGMNFFKKYYKLVDICKNNSNIFVIFDDENLLNELEFLHSILSKEHIISSYSSTKILTRIEVFNTNINRLCL